MKKFWSKFKILVNKSEQEYKKLEEHIRMYKILKSRWHSQA